MSLFGSNSLFGQQGAAQSQSQNQGQQASGGGGGLFGSNTQNQQNSAAGGSGGGGGLFGQSSAQTGGSGGGLFGNAQNQQAQGQQQSSGTGLFGSAPAAGGSGLSGGSSLFGQPQQQQPQQQQSGGGLFGASTAQQPTRPALFGSTTTTQPQPQQQQQQQQQNNASMIGGGSLFASQAPQNGQSTAQQPAGAYFDSLFAKSQKAGESKSNMEDLPTLELGLGDLRHRLRKLQSKPSERPLEGKAHYLLAGAGVDPAAAAKDLGFLDTHGGRPERTTQGYAPSEIDVETYLSNLQTKTTLSMIADGLERSVRDFDNFLEDNVTMEWDAQRKRIYQHFGITVKDDAPAGSKESQGAFGRSRRSKGPQGTSKGRSTFGRSAMQKSVLGAPSKVGMHEPEFADVERAGADGSATAGKQDDRVSRERQSQLSNKVSELNLHRLHKRPYPIFTELGELQKKSPEPHANHVVEAYRAMVEIVGEDAEAETIINNATAKERGFATKYLDENPNSQQSVEMRKRILEGSTKFLEKQFLREVESLIAKHPHEARLGGLPDVTSKIRAYIRLRAARKDLALDTTVLQDHNGEHVWAVVFYLLRSGHIREAAEYVETNQSIFKSLDRTFATYLNNYYKSGDARIIPNPKLRDRCVAEYIGRTRHNDQPEPYRMACYKIIGRADLGNRNLEGLNTDISDWIWLQFNLAREGDKTVEMAGDSFGLAELQSSIREIGLKHFPKANSEDSNGSFGMYFYLQILSGMFEDAIAYLYPFAYVDAVHFGLALTYYGLLRPSDALAGGNDLRSYSTKQLPQINFGRMIGYYTRDFRAADVVSAVDYLTLIALNQDLGGEAGHRHATLSHEALRELVLETREFSKLIGDIRPDGRRISGVIEERGVLIGLDDEADFVNTVTLQAASFADDNGRTTDSVLLYHLAGEYDTVVAIVSRALSEAISLEIGEDPMRLMPVKPRAGGADQDSAVGSSLSLAAIDDPVELAKTMMGMYEKDAMFYRRIHEENRVACRVLLEMSSIKSLVEAGQWANCIDKIRNLEILPLEAAGDAGTIRAYAAKFTSLSQPVSINVPNLLMWTVMACMRQRERLVADGEFSGNEGTRRMVMGQLRQMTLDLTAYTSQLKYRFPPHLHEALARASAD